MSAAGAFNLSARAAAADSPPAATNSVSHFSIPIRISRADLEKLCNEKAPPVIDHELPATVPGFVNEGLSLHINRGHITLSPAAHGAIEFCIPITGTVAFHGQFRPVKFGPHVPVRKTVDFAGTIDGAISPHLKPDWQIEAESKAVIHLDKADAKFNLGVHTFTISFRQKAEKAFDEKGPAMIKGVVDHAIAQFALRPQVERGWGELHMVREVAAAPAVFFTAQPTEIRVAPLAWSGEDLVARVAVAAKVAVLVSAAAVPKVEATPLPAAIIDAHLPVNFDVILPVRIDPVPILAEARKSLEGASFALDTGKTRFDISHVDGKVVADHVELTLDFTATRAELPPVTGKLRISALPEFDPPSGILRLTHITYDTDMENMLLKIWTIAQIQTRLLPEIEHRGKANLNQLLESARGRANEYLGKINSPPNTRLQLGIDKIAATQVRIDRGEIFLLMHVEGTDSLQLQR
jgi:hypothetical protein